jgi:hypothetical protein
MLMAMMKVGSVWVFMSNRVMLVNVGMRFEHRTFMPMLVVLIMNVHMFVLDSPVGVSVAVPFPN